MSHFLIEEFNKLTKDIDYGIYGILDHEDNIKTIGTDSKLIGRIFEATTQPILEKIAENHNLILNTPSSQTVYPDFIMEKNKNDKNKIAIDVKTTYISSSKSNIGFTLGSYGSYMRDNKKNIEYNYTDYKYHFVIGYIYKRAGSAQASQVYSYKDRHKITSPFYDVKSFIQEKYKIAGENPGSGNTENIGSFKTSNIDDLTNGKGPFSKLGKIIYDIYWSHYPKYRENINTYRNIEEFYKWIESVDDPPKILYDYDINEVKNKLESYFEYSIVSL